MISTLKIDAQKMHDVDELQRMASKMSDRYMDPELSYVLGFMIGKISNLSAELEWLK